MYIQVFLQKNCDPFRNSPSGSLAHSLLSSILHKRRRKKKCEHLCVSQHNTQPMWRAVKAESFPQALARQAGQGGPGVSRVHRATTGPSDWEHTSIFEMDAKQDGKWKKKICLCNGGGEKWRTYCSLRYYSNKLNSQHLQMNKLQKHFPLMLNEL